MLSVYLFWLSAWCQASCAKFAAIRLMTAGFWAASSMTSCLNAKVLLTGKLAASASAGNAWLGSKVCMPWISSRNCTGMPRSTRSRNTLLIRAAFGLSSIRSEGKVSCTFGSTVPSTLGPLGFCSLVTSLADPPNSWVWKVSSPSTWVRSTPAFSLIDFMRSNTGVDGSVVSPSNSTSATLAGLSATGVTGLSIAVLASSSASAASSRKPSMRLSRSSFTLSTTPGASVAVLTAPPTENPPMNPAAAALYRRDLPSSVVRVVRYWTFSSSVKLLFTKSAAVSEMISCSASVPASMPPVFRASETIRFATALYSSPDKRSTTCFRSGSSLSGSILLITRKGVANVSRAPDAVPATNETTGASTPSRS